MAKKTQEHKDNISKGLEGNKNADKYEGKKTDTLIYKLCLLGLTDKDIANVIGVTETTLNNWKIEHSSVFESIRNGKEIADANVVASLYKRAIGFEHDAVKIFQNQGVEVIIPYKEYVIPDVTAQKKWLSARQRKIWSESLNLTGGQDENGIDKPIGVNHQLPDWLRIKPNTDKIE